MAQITHTSPHANLQVTDQSGQSSCFNCVIEIYQTQAYNLARRMLSDWALAKDAVQESFVSAYRAFNRFRGENLTAWVLRIVSNTCRDMLRARKSRPAVSLDPLPSTDSDEPQGPSAVDLPSDEASPEDRAEQSELRAAIQGCLDGLQEDRRLAVLLVDVHGLSYEEASESMGCSLGTVKSRVSRGRGGMRDCLQNTGELLPSRFRQEV
ncbi:MAG: RNA polymerase subunit sigma-24 [Chloroflexi bacterium]|jgi:RNA polymerase sigma-70 factor (ECF subfamily)|nr:sigma-70 family RNA polymerase sigma factor [Dehalococcoidia bacterium]RUA22895.1 MAG: RNA polymerase subunit sigma-24 [Chloroflexota bacterium]RUA31940.1 MAG: RNA polymerase subunit sigma-24 [Chloroflexota bacterium]|tara:strand:+ start:886 stop:1512 length:627 start_codon:yes stop_codon:yes gene_type:complete